MSQTTTRTTTELDSPLGRLRAVMEDGALIGLYFEDHPGAPSLEDAIEDAEPFAALAEQLAELFAGRRAELDLPIAFRTGTAFQREVWAALRTIEHGSTISYAELAAQLGRPGAARAVGAANAKNPISIVVPCHRVIGHDGSLTGYAGGVERKRWLLSLERGSALGASVSDGGAS